MRTRALPTSLLAAAIAIACATAACKATKTSQGELMVTIETDLLLPKDIDDVDVEVLQGDESVFSQSLATGAASLRLPSTLALLAGRDSTSPIRIRVVGRQNGAPRMIREVVTTAPTDRVAMIRVPLTWWCDGSATVGAGAAVSSTCPNGATCIAGSCAPPAIDPSTLPTYDAKEVFGGSLDPASGTCFDVAACFAGADEVPIDASACTVPRPPSDGAGVNLAVLLPPGSVDGFCDDRGCLLPLDADGETAWQPSNGATISLPPVVCTRIHGGALLAVMRSTSCATKVQRTPSCGPASSVGRSDAGADTAPVTLAGPLNQAQGFALAGGRVIWTTALSVQTVPVEGGATTTLGPVPTFALDGFVATSTTAYFADALLNGSVTQFPLDGSASSTFASSLHSIVSIAVDARSLYVAANNGAPGISAVPLAGGPPVSLLTIPLGGVDALSTSMAVDATRLYFGVTAAGTSGASIESIPITGGSAQAVTTTNGNPLSLTVDANAIYWVDDLDASSPSSIIYRAALSGGGPIALAVNQPSAQALAVDDAYVYWTLRGDAQNDYKNGAVRKTLKSGTGAVLTVATGEAGPRAIAVDATSIYWQNLGTSSASFTDGAIRRAFK